MSKTRYSIQTARSCFRTWRNAPRMLVLLGMIACFTIIYVIPFAENAKAMGETLQITEAFTAMLNWRFSMLLFSIHSFAFWGSSHHRKLHRKCACQREQKRVDDWADDLRCCNIFPADTVYLRYFRSGLSSEYPHL